MCLKFLRLWFLCILIAWASVGQIFAAETVRYKPVLVFSKPVNSLWKNPAYWTLQLLVGDWFVHSSMVFMPEDLELGVIRGATKNENTFGFFRDGQPVDLDSVNFVWITPPFFKDSSKSNLLYDSKSYLTPIRKKGEFITQMVTLGGRYLWHEIQETIDQDRSLFPLAGTPEKIQKVEEFNGFRNNCSHMNSQLLLAVADRAGNQPSRVDPSREIIRDFYRSRPISPTSLMASLEVKGFAPQQKIIEGSGGPEVVAADRFEYGDMTRPYVWGVALLGLGTAGAVFAFARQLQDAP